MRKAMLADPDASYIVRGFEPTAALARELARFSELDADVASGRFGVAEEQLHEERARLDAELVIQDPGDRSDLELRRLR